MHELAPGQSIHGSSGLLCMSCPLIKALPFYEGSFEVVCKNFKFSRRREQRHKTHGTGYVFGSQHDNEARLNGKL